MVDPLESSTKGYRPRGPRRHRDDYGALDRQDWWDDTDIMGLDDLETLSHYLDNYDYLLEASNSGEEGSSIIPQYSGH
jgi:hypothetical protein